jgi:hypothetical protein
MNPDYGTPPAVVAVVRALMGGIDLDPCTTRAVNAWHVRASMIVEPPADGLKVEWRGRVFCNPPGGKKNDPLDWWEHRLREFVAGRCTSLFYVAFSLDRLQTSQRLVPLTMFPTFVPAARVAYLHHDDGEREVKRKRKGVASTEIVPHRAGEVDGQPPKPSAFTWVTREEGAKEKLAFAFARAGVKGIVL